MHEMGDTGRFVVKRPGSAAGLPNGFVVGVMGFAQVGGQSIGAIQELIICLTYSHELSRIPATFFE